MSKVLITDRQYKAIVEQTHQLLAALHAHHAPTYYHSLQVGKVTQAFLRYLEWSPQEIILGTTAALLHDIGKLRVDKELWSKEQGITILEYIQMDAHPVHSQNILMEGAVFPPLIIEAVVQHHERPDGTGYPNKLKGTEISVLAKIISIVSDYLALQEVRPGQPMRNAFQVMTHMDEHKEHYDQEIFEQWQEYLRLSRGTLQHNKKTMQRTISA
ncbi:HD domain-containing protein [Heliorestis acidaminivorans]|uniref:HD domain-containing protein n=1 Tax=Heliorestis acidaminivorans TaxID=553427 RepID=A0A6I0F7H3_9FIRM|nr:HD domain-containing phosphohydrolase [Heliorestis acidaminivorans]KAB2953343.1 HD domain-containing protein [Heliorestis acidaminivorans]